MNLQNIFLFFKIDRYLLRDDSAWITRLSKDFWWNLERISEMTTTPIRENPVKQILAPTNNSARKIVGQRSAIIRPDPTNIPDKLDDNHDMEYNPFQSRISFDNNIWTNSFQQAIPWQ